MRVSPKLAPYLSVLIEMRGAGLDWKQIAERLQTEHGVKVHPSSVNGFFKRKWVQAEMANRKKEQAKGERRNYITMETEPILKMTPSLFDMWKRFETNTTAKTQIEIPIKLPKHVYETFTLLAHENSVPDFERLVFSAIRRVIEVASREHKSQL